MAKNIRVKSNKNQSLERKNVKVKIDKNRSEKGVYSLNWSDKERKELESRILRLREDQIGALLWLVGLEFAKDDIDHVVQDIVTDKQESGHLCILTDEADSKENLLWWIDYFEKANKG